MLDVFARVDAWITALVIAVTMLAAWGVGWRRGLNLRAEGEEPPAKFEDASLALLGLLLAFTFSLSLAKYDRRREMVVADSNAIGDFYTCASLLKDPVRTELQAIIREYVELRLDLSRKGYVALLQRDLPKFDEMHARMTRLVGEALQQGTPIASPLTVTLNGVISSQTSRLAAVRDRLPFSIVVLLFLAAAVSSALVGLQQGALGKRHLAGTFSFVLLVSLVVYVTLDLNQPRRGLITVSQEPMQRLLSTMSQ